jgi:hypothetical protein
MYNEKFVFAFWCVPFVLYLDLNLSCSPFQFFLSLSPSRHCAGVRRRFIFPFAGFRLAPGRVPVWQSIFVFPFVGSSAHADRVFPADFHFGAAVPHWIFPIFGLSAESLALPSLISLDLDLSPVHASLVRWSVWLPILFIYARSHLDLVPDRLFLSRAKDTFLHPRFAARGFPAHPACRGLQSSVGLFQVEYTSCSLGSSKGSILVQISCGLLHDLVPVYSSATESKNSRFCGPNCSLAVIS